jgi:hypothetical protein
MDAPRPRHASPAKPSNALRALRCAWTIPRRQFTRIVPLRLKLVTVMSSALQIGASFSSEWRPDYAGLTPVAMRVGESLFTTT